MVKMKGEARVFDSYLVNENKDSTSTLRKLNVYGIKTLSELTGIIIPVKPVKESVGKATEVEIFNYVWNTETMTKDYTSLGKANLKVIKNGVKTNPTEAWTTLNSFYYLIYDGEDFIAYDINISGDLNVLIKTVEDILDVKLPLKVDKSSFSKVSDSVVSGITVQHTTGNSGTNIVEQKVNILDGTVTSSTKALPVASSTDGGLMPKESFNQINENTTRIEALENQGGRFIGISFKTYADLQKYTIPNDVNVGDFTYVLDDENYDKTNPPTTRYIVVDNAGKKEFSFAYVINHDPVGLFTNTVAGIIKGSSDKGKIKAESDGTGSVNGWSDLTNQVNDLEDQVNSTYSYKNVKVNDKTVIATQVGDTFELVEGNRINLTADGKKITVDVEEPKGAIANLIDSKMFENKVLISDTNGDINTSLISNDELNALSGINTDETIQKQLNDIVATFGTPLKTVTGTINDTQYYPIAICRQENNSVEGQARFRVIVKDGSGGVNFSQELLFDVVGSELGDISFDILSSSGTYGSSEILGLDELAHRVPVQIGGYPVGTKNIAGGILVKAPDSTPRDITVELLEARNWTIVDEIKADEGEDYTITGIGFKINPNGRSVNRTIQGTITNATLSTYTSKLRDGGFIAGEDVLANDFLVINPELKGFKVTTNNAVVKLPQPRIGYIETSKNTNDSILLFFGNANVIPNFDLPEETSIGDNLYIQGELDENKNFKSHGVITNKMSSGYSFIPFAVVVTDNKLRPVISPRCYTIDKFGKLTAIDGQPAGGGSEYGIKNKVYITTGSANAYKIEDTDLNLEENNIFFIKAHATSTGSSTLNVNGKTLPLYRFGTTVLHNGALYAEGIYEILYTDTAYYLINPLPQASTTMFGVIKLNNTLTSTSVSDAATANTVKQLKDLIDSNNSQLDGGKQDNITGAASTITSSNLTANRAVISNGSGKVAVSSVTSTELGYLSGVKSSVQTQINTANTNISTNATDIDNLESSKVNKSAFTNTSTANNVVSDISITKTADSVSISEQKVDVTSGTVTSSTNALPISSETQAGLMPKESFNQINENTTRIEALENQGGKYIGQSFANKAALDAYDIPDTVNVGDFTFVADDEAHSEATTRYICSIVDSSKKFVFAYVINYDPVGSFTNTSNGLIKGSSDVGKVAAESDGTGSVNGWDALVNRISDVESNIESLTETSDGKQAAITGAASTITSSNLTANRALVSNGSGKVAVSPVTSTELGYLSGVTDNIQTQINNLLNIGKAYKANFGNGTDKSYTITHNLNTRDVIVQIYDNSTYKEIFADVARTTVNTVTISGFITPPTTNQYRVLIQSVHN